MGDFLRVRGANVVKGAGRLLVSELATGFPDEINDVILTASGATQYDAATGWEDLFATDGGIVINRGFETEGYTVDQVNGDLDEEVTGWTNSVETSLAETTLENFQLAWVGNTISANTVTPIGAPSEDRIDFGDPTDIPVKQLAIAFMDKNGYIRLYVFRNAKRAGDESSLTHQKGGDPLTLPVLFNAYADTETSGLTRDDRIFSIFQQVETP